MGSKNPESPSRRNRANEPAYVLFASTFAREFYAVVPTYNPIPNLLLSPGWRFVRILKGRDARQPCLRGKSAMTAFARDGYYLFANRQFAPEPPKPPPQVPNTLGRARRRPATCLIAAKCRQRRRMEAPCLALQ